NAVFIFQAPSSTLTTASGSRVNLINGAQACNVFWQIGSSATLGGSTGGSSFIGNILALTSITINNGVTVGGRALARNGAVTLDNDTITAAHCAPGTTGGPPTPGGGTTGGDTRAPAAPILLSPRAHARVRAGNVSFRWRAAARAERYTLMVDHHRMNTGPRTRATMRVRPGSHSFRVIARNRNGAGTSRRRSFRAVTATMTPSVDMIRRGLGLDALQKDVVASAERITLKAAEGTAFRSALRSLGKLASRASVLGFLVALGFEKGDLSCDDAGLLYRRAKPVFKDAGYVLDEAARAGVGRHPVYVANLAKVRRELKALKKFTDTFQTHQHKECRGPGKVALQTIKTLQPRLDAAGARLQELEQVPTKKECMTTLKLLKGFKKYADDHNIKIGKKRLTKLNRKLREKTLRPNDLPKGIRDHIPSFLHDKSLSEIEELCKHAR
ncbi:MAG: hypothetical protein DLM61_22405, partial [Pseudonocardiales bacterium]